MLCLVLAGTLSLHNAFLLCTRQHIFHWHSGRFLTNCAHCARLLQLSYLVRIVPRRQFFSLDINKICFAHYQLRPMPVFTQHKLGPIEYIHNGQRSVSTYLDLQCHFTVYSLRFLTGVYRLERFTHWLYHKLNTFHGFRFERSVTTYQRIKTCFARIMAAYSETSHWYKWL